MKYRSSLTFQGARFMASNSCGAPPMLACTIQLERFGGSYTAHVERGYPTNPTRRAHSQVLTDALMRLALLVAWRRIMRRGWRIMRWWRVRLAWMLACKLNGRPR